MTRVLGVRGELASLRGLKLRRALMILFEVPGRVLTRIDMQFNVESTSRASLQFRVELVTRALQSKAILLPALLQSCQHSVQESRRFSFQVPRIK
jgi:hypothetical protein